MKILIGQEIENHRLQELRKNKVIPSVPWEFYKGIDFKDVTSRAAKMGWAKNDVQVRVTIENGEAMYLIEPFEKDCGCPNIIKYERVFGPKAQIGDG